MSTQYVVSVKLTADDQVSDVIRKITGGLGAATTGASAKMADGVRAFSQSFSMFGGAVRSFRNELNFLRNTYHSVTAITGFGIQDVIKGAISINQELENVQLSLTTVLNAVDSAESGPFADLNMAQAETTRLMALMRSEAAKTPAEFEGIAQSFMTILPLARSLTGNMDELVSLSANVATWDIMAGRKGVTAQDIRQILGGQLSITQIQNPLLKQNLDRFKELKEESLALEKSGKSGVEQQKKQLEIITKLLTLSKPVREMWEDSFTGSIEAVKGTLKLLLQEGTAPIWQELKSVLKGFQDYVTTPAGAQRIREIFRDAAGFLKDVTIAFYDVFSWIFENFGAIKAAFLTFAGIWGAVTITKFIGALYAFAGAVKAGAFLDFAKALAGFGGGGLAAGAGGAAAAATGSTFFKGLGRSLLNAVKFGGGVTAGIWSLLSADEAGAGENEWARKQMLGNVPEEMEPLIAFRKAMAGLQAGKPQMMSRSFSLPEGSVGLTVPEWQRDVVATTYEGMNKLDKNDAQYQASMAALQSVSNFIAAMQTNQIWGQQRRWSPGEAQAKVVIEIQGAEAKVKSSQSSGIQVDVGTSNVASGSDE